jgi:predicted dehydrogenase
MKSNETNSLDVTRRDFIKGSSAAALAALMNGLPAQGQTAPGAPEEKKPTGPPVKCAVIGLGIWGREILSTLARLPQAEVAAICDTYPSAMRRGGNIAPQAAKEGDYRKVLADKEIQAVLIATPSHRHKEVALAALAAGKHVYCEAPLAASLEEARAIARAAGDAFKQYFQAGLQYRSDPQRAFMMPHIRNGALGKWVMARAQWHKKQSWRQAAPTLEREKELNWRLRQETSPGLMGEIGIHQLDSATWFLDMKPLSVTGLGAVRGEWNDERTVADTAQAVVEFAEGVQFTLDCTMANSFDSEYELYYGGNSAVMLRGNRAWLFKEVDAPLLGWEVFARKETFYKETGLVLAANATKINPEGERGPETAPLAQTPLHYALENFLHNASEISGGIEDFAAAFNPSDTAALKKYLADLRLLPYAGCQEAFAATVLALKANEAVVKGQKIVFRKEWFEVG